MKIIFLDIDGVLNGHDWDEDAKSNRIRHECVQQLSRIVTTTGAKIVLSSAWRYMILRGAMTCLGFEYLLRTHGACGCRVIGTTCSDEEIENRADQILAWIAANPVSRWVSLDDETFDLTKLDGHLVLCGGNRGLTEQDADSAIRILNP